MVTGFEEAAASRTGSAAASTCWARRPWRRCPSAATTRRARFPSSPPRAARRVPLRRRLAHRQHAEGPPPRRGVRRRQPALAGGVTRVRLRAAAGREAVGLGADLGAHRPLLREAPLRPRRASRSRPSTTGRRTSRGTSRRAAPSSSSPRVGDAERDESRSRPATLSLPAADRPPRARDRGHAHHRGLDAGDRRRRAARGRVRPGGHLRTLT